MMRLMAIVGLLALSACAMPEGHRAAATDGAVSGSSVPPDTNVPPRAGMQSRSSGIAGSPDAAAGGMSATPRNTNLGFPVYR